MDKGWGEDDILSGWENEYMTASEANSRLDKYILDKQYLFCDAVAKDVIVQFNKWKTDNGK